MKKREEWDGGGWAPGCVVLMTLAMVAGLMLTSCGSAKKMSSDVAARDSVHRERREVVADSLCQKAMRDRVLESAAEVTIVIEEEFWADPSRPDPKRDSLEGGPEEKCPSPVARRRTTITARKDVKEMETETQETMAKTITKTEELKDSVAEEEEHVKEEREGRSRWPWSQAVWFALCAWVVWKVWRKDPPRGPTPSLPVREGGEDGRGSKRKQEDGRGWAYPLRFALPNVALGSATLRGHRMTSSHSSKDPLLPLSQGEKGGGGFTGYWFLGY